MGENRITVCPECGDADITPRSGRNGGGRRGDPDADYRCQACGARFDAPADRERRGGRNGPGNNGLAKRLAEADPDAIPDGGVPLCPVCETAGRLDEESPDEIYVCESAGCLVGCYTAHGALATDGGVVPEDFDLAAALDAPSSTPRDQRKRCPSCKGVRWRPKADRDHPAGRDRDNPEPYWCRDCEAHIERLLEPGDPGYPDDVSGDGGGR